MTRGGRIRRPEAGDGDRRCCFLNPSPPCWLDVVYSLAHLQLHLEPGTDAQRAMELGQGIIRRECRRIFAGEEACQGGRMVHLHRLHHVTQCSAHVFSTVWMPSPSSRSNDSAMVIHHSHGKALPFPSHVAASLAGNKLPPAYPPPLSSLPPPCQPTNTSLAHSLTRSLAHLLTCSFTVSPI